MKKLRIVEITHRNPKDFSIYRLYQIQEYKKIWYKSFFNSGYYEWKPVRIRFYNNSMGGTLYKNLEYKTIKEARTIIADMQKETKPDRIMTKKK